MESESRDHQHQDEACAGIHQSDCTFKEEDVPGLAEALAEVSYKWEEIAVMLGLPKSVIEDCRGKCSSLAMKLYNVLHTWVVGHHSNAAQATWENLKTVLASRIVQHPKFASELEDKLKTSLNLHTYTTSQKKFIFKGGVGEVLMKQYSQNLEVPRSFWLPVVSKRFINLALIETSGQPSNSDYSIRGDTDDILAKKVQVQYEDIFDVYKKAGKILILGRPGSGKTTLVHKLVRDWSAGKALQGAELVFLVSLRMLGSKKKCNLTQLLKNEKYFYDEEDLKHIVGAMKQNQGRSVCFIFDGFDEYSSQNRDESVIFPLLDKSYLVDAMIIVTSRFAAVSHLAFAAGATEPWHTSYNIIEVFGFSKSQVMEYVKKFPFSSSSSVNEAHSQKLQSFLSSHPGVLDLCYLPVNCAIICFIYSKKPDHFPDTQTQIYALFTRLIIIRQLTSKGALRQLDSLEDLEGQEAEDFKKLCYLAFDMTTQSQQVITRGPASRDEAHSLGLVTIDITAGLSGYKNSYSFLHLTLQEFLAAYHLSTLNSEEQMSLIEKYSNTVHMLTVWKFYFGLVNFATGTDRAVKLFASVNLKNGYVIDTQLFKVQCAYEARQPCIVQLVSSKQMDFVSMIVFSNYDMSAIAYTISMAATLATPTTQLVFQFYGPLTDQLNFFFSKLNDRALECLEDLEINYTSDASTTTQVEALANKLNGMGQTGTGLKNLKSLNLRGPIRDKGVIVLANGLDGNHMLEALNVSSNSISATGLCKLMKSDCRLRCLDLSCNNIGDEGVAVLVGGLDGNHVLKSLLLADCGITAASISELLKAKCHLQCLDLSSNAIDDEGAKAVARGLKNILTLKTINLSHNNIGVTGIETLAWVLQNPLSLDLSSNNITSNLVSCEKTTSSSFPSFDTRGRDHRSFDGTVHEVQGSYDLQELNLSCNNVNGDIMKIISKFKSLSSLDLSENYNIDEPRALAIVDYVAKSKNCRQLQYLGLSCILRDRSGFMKVQEEMPYHLFSGFIIDLSYNNIINKTKMVAFLQSVKNYDRVGAVYLKGTNINNDKNTTDDLEKAFQHCQINRLIILDISQDLYIKV